MIGYLLHRNNALIFTVQYIIINIFTILMTYFHWPYEVKKDLIYDEHNHVILDQVQPTIFINEDYDN